MQKESKAKIVSAPKNLLTVFVLSVISLALVFNFLNDKPKLYLGNAEPLIYELADTKSERIQGLSDRINLKDNRAMLFVFEESDYHGIWMKDMNFSIDIIWLDDMKHVVYIEESVSPNSYPQVFMPSVPAKYVIETNAGWVEENSLQVGSTARF